MRGIVILLFLSSCAWHASAAVVKIRFTTYTSATKHIHSSHRFYPRIYSATSNCATGSINSPGSGDVDTVSASCSFSAEDVTQVKVPAPGSDGWRIRRVDLWIRDAWMPLWAVNVSPRAFDTWVDVDPLEPQFKTGIFEMLPLRILVTTHTGSNSQSVAEFKPTFVSTTGSTCAGTTIDVPDQGDSHWSVAGCFSNFDRAEIPAPNNDGWSIASAYHHKERNNFVQLVAVNERPPTLTPFIDGNSGSIFERSILRPVTFRVRIVTQTSEYAKSSHTYEPKFISKSGTVCSGTGVASPRRGSSIWSYGACTFPVSELDRVEISNKGNDGWDINSLFVEIAPGIQIQWWAVNESPPQYSTIVDGNGASHNRKCIYKVPDTEAPDTDAPPTPFPDTLAPDTDAPPTPFPDTLAPDTDAPPTPFPDTLAPDTDAPLTPFPDTLAPDTDAPPTPFPDTLAPDTPAPDTTATPGVKVSIAGATVPGKDVNGEMEFSNSEAVLTMIPENMREMQVHTPAAIPKDTTITLSCYGTEVCEFILSHYHCPPCSGKVNGGFPALLPLVGFESASCAPKWGLAEQKMVSHRVQVDAGASLVLPETTEEATSFVIFSKVGELADPWCQKAKKFGCGGPCLPSKCTC